MSNLVLPSPPGLSRTVKRTAERRVSIQRSESGAEYATRRWLAPIRSWELTYKLRTAATYKEMQTVARFLAVHAGAADSFLFRDPEDYQVNDHGFSVGDGTKDVFQLQRALDGYTTDLLGTWPLYHKARKNWMVWGEAWTDFSYWNGGGTGSSVVGPRPAPDGTMTAVELVIGNGARLYADVATGPAAGVASDSIWARLTAGTRAVTFYLKDKSTDTIRGSQAATLTTSWQRLSASGTTGVAGGRVEIAGFTAADHVVVWGAQLEAGASSTRYISTPGAVATATPSYWPLPSDGFEPVMEPGPGIAVTKDAAALVQGTDFDVGSHGVLTFAAAPASGAQLAWTGSFYRRVRFDGDDSELERLAATFWKTGRMRLVEVLPKWSASLGTLPLSLG